jgi:hypothetical protein
MGVRGLKRGHNDSGGGHSLPYVAVELKLASNRAIIDRRLEE